MRKIICIRDDDTSFYTKYQELVDGYGEFWGKIPITLAVVPFVHGSEKKIIELEYPPERRFINLREWELSASGHELTQYHKVYPIGENEQLINDLKKLIKCGKIEVAQHGVFHRYNEFGAEMYHDNIGMENIRAGKEYLSKIFETEIKTFIPPSNTIDLICARYVRDLDMNLLTCGGISFRTRRERFIQTCKYPVDIIKTVKNIVLEETPVVRKRKGIDLYSAITFGYNNSVEEIYEKVNKILDKNNAVVITTHYRLLGEFGDEKMTYRNKWQQFLAMLCRLENVEFVTASKYVSELEKKNEKYFG